MKPWHIFLSVFLVFVVFGAGMYAEHYRITSVIRDDPCLGIKWDLIDKATAYISLPPGGCAQLGPGLHMKGVWIDEFEHQEFVENASKWTEPNYEKSIWFDVDNQLREWLRLKQIPAREREEYFVEFVGRKTRTNGRYGHMGMSQGLVVPGAFLSIIRLDKPAK